MSTILLYFFAAIGALVVGAAAFLFLAWQFVRLVASAQLRRLARRDALTPSQNQ